MMELAETLETRKREMKRAWLETIASRLNAGVAEDFTRSGNLAPKSESEVKDLLSPALKHVGGFRLERIPGGGEECGLIRVNFREENHCALLYDGIFFFVGNPNRLEGIRKRKEASSECGSRASKSAAFDIGGVIGQRWKEAAEAVLAAVKKGDTVYIDGRRYYTRGINVFFVTLYAWDDLDAAAGLGGKPFDLEKGTWASGLPIQRYSIDIENFEEGLVSDPMNRAIVEKMGLTGRERKPSPSPIPAFRVTDELFYGAGERVFLGGGRECLVIAVGNSRVWYVDAAGIPNGEKLPGVGRVNVFAERREEFERRFFGDIRNLGTVRRREYQDTLEEIRRSSLEKDGE
jgi:hypothetical protein